MWGKITDISIKPFLPPPSCSGLEELFLQVRTQPYAMLLLSGGDLDCSRYSIMGWNPFLVLRSQGRKVDIVESGVHKTMEADPFTVLEDMIRALDLPESLPLEPFCAGGMGFFAYDLKNHLERLPTTAWDDLQLPEMVLAFPQHLIVHDRRDDRYWQVQVEYAPSSSPDRFSAPSRRSSPELVWQHPGTPLGDYQVGPLQSNFSPEDYITAVGRVRQYIRQGDVYQVNLSQRFSFPFQGDPYRLFLQLFQRNPAPFYAFLNLGDFQILSTSMERFLYRRGDYLETRPIKGTRPRGRDPAEDEANRLELLSSRKDEAELSMIVDLLRNDLGKVCQRQSVQVIEHKRLEAYQNVYHLISIVTGKLNPDCTPVEILRATFPGGSITGCPKIRAMEIIDELEPLVRHVYTGAIGYIGLHQNLDLNIAIRTALYTKGKVHFAVGGGIVYDSNEEDEYQETLHKGQTLFSLIGQGGRG